MTFFTTDAITLGLKIPGVHAAGMLLVGHQDFVAWLKVDAVGDVAISLGGIAKQGNLIAMATDESGQRIAKLVPRGVSPYGVVFGILLVHSLGGGIAIENGAQHGRRAGANGSVVEVDLVFGDQELAPDLGPIGVFVLVKESRIGKGGRSLLELSDEISTERQGCSESGGGGGEKAATVEQWHLLMNAKQEGAMLRLSRAFLKGDGRSSAPRLRAPSAGHILG